MIPCQRIPCDCSKSNDMFYIVRVKHMQRLPLEISRTDGLHGGHLHMTMRAEWRGGDGALPKPQE